MDVTKKKRDGVWFFCSFLSFVFFFFAIIKIMMRFGL